MFLLAMILFAGAMTMMGSEANTADVPSSAAARFPELSASNLEGHTLVLPRDFEGERNLLLVAFEREQQKNVDTWLKEMKQFEQLDSGLHYYELPTIEKMNALTRWFIDSGMRRGIPDKSARERTITLYIDKKPFEQSLQLPTEKTIYALLVDRSGNVLWRAEGDFDEAKAASLREALKGPGKEK